MIDVKKYFGFLLFTALGIFLGVGIYTFIYSKGYSYLSDDPKACVNCHIMRDNFDTWFTASHRNVTCNGCHTPHNIVNKYIVKGENGFNHSLAFTLGAPDVIKIKSRSADVVENNCIRCHQNMITSVFMQRDENRQRCFSCHRKAGHSL